VIDRLSAGLKQTLAMPDVKDAMAKQGFTPMEMGPEEFGKFYTAEAAKWSKVVETVGLGR
jgi:tripartite-type tricarboxylate transporter receptor subunit TctC